MNIETPTDEGSPEAIVRWEEPEVHGGKDDLWVLSSHKPGDSFPIGCTIVTYVVYDQTNTTITDCQFEICVRGMKATEFVQIVTQLEAFLCSVIQ